MSSPTWRELTTSDASADVPGLDAGDDVPEQDGAEGGLEPIRTAHCDSDQGMYYALEIEGQGFTDLDGRVVTVRIGRPNTPFYECLGSAQVRVESGAFSLHLPPVLEDGLYKQKLVHIDVDGDGTCSPADVMFENASSAFSSPFVWRLGPTSIDKVAPDSFARSCDVLRNWPSP
jgi:hypothetical protein